MSSINFGNDRANNPLPYKVGDSFNGILMGKGKQTMAELKVAKTGGKSEQQKNAHTRNLKKMMNLTDSLADSEMVN